MAVKTKEEMVREQMDECAELVAAEFFPAVRPVYRTKRGLKESENAYGRFRRKTLL
jgi:hypothetical protein